MLNLHCSITFITVNKRRAVMKKTYTAAKYDTVISTKPS